MGGISRQTAAIGATFLLVACAGANPGKAIVEVAPTVKLTGPKIVAIMGTRNDVVVALEDALAARGFTFKHYQSRDRVTAPAGQAKPVESAADNTKYAIEVVPDIFDRCAGGGFQLTSLRVSVVDRASNELMLRSTAKGRTEKCPPTSGSVFHDIADAINAAWQN